MAYEDPEERFREDMINRKRAARWRARRSKIKTPKSREGDPVPLFYGQIRQRSPAVVWWGDHGTKEVSGPFGIEPVQVFYAGMALALGTVGDPPSWFTGEPAIARLTKIWLGDKVLRGDGISQIVHLDADDEIISSDTNTLDTDSSIVEYGGTAGVGGAKHFVREVYEDFYGDLRWGGGDCRVSWSFYPGTLTQTADPYLFALDAMGPTKASGHRGTCYVVFNGISATPGLGSSWGQEAVIANMSFEISYMPNLLMSTVSKIGTDPASLDANPAEVLYDLLINDLSRRGIDRSRVNANSFRAAALTLAAEGNGVSFIIDETEQTRDVINEILRQIDGVLYEAPDGAGFVLDLIRNDYVVADLPVLDESNVEGVSDYSTPLFARTYNQVRVIYNSRVAGYEDRPLVQTDHANWAAQGNKLHQKTIDYPYCTSAVLAASLAARDLKPLSTPLLRCTVEANRDAYAFRPGVPFVLNWAEYGITGVVMRPRRIDWGTLDDDTIKIEAVQDAFDLGGAYFYETPFATTYPVAPPLEAPADVDHFEAPKWFADAAAIEPGSADPGAFVQVHVARPVTADAGGSGFMTTYSLTGLPGTQVGEGRLDGVDDLGYGRERQYTEHALVSTLYLRTLEPYDTGTGLVIKSVSDTSALVAATPAEIALGANLIKVGSEIMAFESFTDLGGDVYSLDSVWRGLLGTAAVEHAVDERVWFIATVPAGVRLLARKFETGDVVTAASRPSSAAETMRTGDVANTATTIVNRALSPFPPSDFQIDGANDYPGIDVAGDADNWIVAPEVTGTWKRRDRLTSSIIRGDAVDDTPSEAVRYRPLATLGNDARVQIGNGAIDDTVVENLQSIGHGSGPIEIRAERGGLKNSWGDWLGTPGANAVEPFPAIASQIAHFRQLLINPHFDDVDDGREWTLVSGTPSYTDSASSFGFAGKHIVADTDIMRVEQVIDVAALEPAGKDLLVTFKARNLGVSATGCVQVYAFSEEYDTTLHDTADSTLLSPSLAHWDSQEIRITGLHPLTEQIRIQVNLAYYAGGGGTNGALDAMDVRLAPAISADLIVNGGFNASLASWTPTNFAYSTSNNSEGAGVAAGGAGTSGDVIQVVALPTGYSPGDVAHLKLLVFLASGSDEAVLELIARDSGASILRSQSDTAALTADGEWHEYNLYLRIPDETADFLISLSASDEDTSGGLENSFDDVRMRIYSDQGLSTSVGSAAGTSTATAVGESIVTGVGSAAGVSLVVGYEEI